MIQNLGYVAKIRRVYVCNIFRPKYGLLSYATNTICMQIVHNSTTMGKIQILPFTYGTISQPRHLSRKDE
jgi:hypothetical protein